VQYGASVGLGSICGRAGAVAVESVKVYRSHLQRRVRHQVLRGYRSCPQRRSLQEFVALTHNVKVRGRTMSAVGGPWQYGASVTVGEGCSRHESALSLLMC